MQRLDFRSPLSAYDQQAEDLRAGQRSGDPEAIAILKRNHPRFLDEKIPWLQKNVTDAEVQSAPLDRDDARLAIARHYCFRDWPSLAVFVESLDDPAVFRFESAVEAVIEGDAAALRQQLAHDPALVGARSTRVCHFDPPQHRATLLHYVAANGVEDHRQRTPANAVEIAKILLESGAGPDALAHMYGGKCTTMSMLVSSIHPAAAGVQVALIDTLVDFGASVEARGEGNWTSPLMTALIFGFQPAAEALVRRGANVANVAAAAGLGRVEDVRRLLPHSDAESRQVALSLAAQLGYPEIVRLLLDAGEDPSRYNPPRTHAHTTPLHQAALRGHEAVVRLLVERGADLAMKDKIYQATPLGWAEHAGQQSIAHYLRAHGATLEGR